MSPTLKEEKFFWSRGLNSVAGLDEVGRGPLAGPVVAAAVMINPGYKILKGVKDSKKLSVKQREQIYKKLTENENIFWGLSSVSEEIIDKVNILEATKMAMELAVQELQEKISRKVNCLILDGDFEINSTIAQRSIIKADEKVFSCAAASIIAKVNRDRTMDEFHEKYPQYGFDHHKGYGTALHLSMLAKFGPCKIHRKSFFPISQSI